MNKKQMKIELEIAIAKALIAVDPKVKTIFLL